MSQPDFPLILLHPSEMELAAFMEELHDREETLPALPPQKRSLGGGLAMILIFLLLGPLALVIQVARIPFVIVRALRIQYLKGRHTSVQADRHGDDPRHHESFPGIVDKEPRHEKQEEASRIETKAKLAKLEAQYQQDPTQILAAHDYAVIHVHLLGMGEGVFILEQLRKAMEQSGSYPDPKLSLAQVLHNYGVALRFTHPRLSAQYLQQAANMPGFTPPAAVKGKRLRMIVVAVFSPIWLSWQGLQKSVAKAWPQVGHDPFWDY